MPDEMDPVVTTPPVDEAAMSDNVPLEMTRTGPPDEEGDGDEGGVEMTEIPDDGDAETKAVRGRIRQERRERYQLWLNNLCARLRHERKQRNLTLKDAAAETGLSPLWISQFESGKKNKKPSMEMIWMYADYLGVNMGQAATNDPAVMRHLAVVADAIEAIRGMKG